ncbi:MAG: GIY-YIG nuclease family protein [Putridiphycobacter sp.]|nr:GIY-YIG nuclease family protein [Putridiphycobacter sp.]
MIGYMYILKCDDESYYVGSTKDLEFRIKQHQNGEGANHTKKRLPVELIYFEKFNRIDEAFYREKQVQGWTRKKKEALMAGATDKLHQLAKCLNETSHVGFGSAQPTDIELPKQNSQSLNKNEELSKQTIRSLSKSSETLQQTKRSLSENEELSKQTRRSLSNSSEILQQSERSLSKNAGMLKQTRRSLSGAETKADQTQIKLSQKKK